MFSRNYRNCGCMNNNDYDFMDVDAMSMNNGCGCNNDDDSVYDNSCGCGNYSNDDYMNDCACGYNEPYSVFPSDSTLAESYVPMQYLNQAYKSCIGLKNGTIFPELVSPYRPCQSMEVIEYLKNANTIGEGCNQCQQ